MIDLKRLAPQFRALLTPEFLAGTAPLGPDVKTHEKEFVRPDGFDKPNIEHLIGIVEKAMEKYPGGRPRAIESDQWLAPRVHATLRLTRREAGDPTVWNYLAAVHLEHYVRWRWADEGNGKIVPERFLCGEYNKHAIARLWWGAELTRNGPDYTVTRHLFVNQDLQNSWVKTRLFRHRPTALASLRLLSTYKDGEFADSNTIRDLVKSFNMALTTTMLDAVAPSIDVDAQSVRDWCQEDVDETTMFEAMPDGPAEAPIDEAHIIAVTELLKRVVSKTKFTKRERGAAKVSV